jgi:hypothetical protein
LHGSTLPYIILVVEVLLFIRLYVLCLVDSHR